MKRLLALLLLCPPLVAAEPVRPPNILFILADDLGWMDLACQGNEHLHTPHLDRFAAESLRFTDAYAPSPVCSPTRAAVLTGLSPARLHLTNHLPHQDRFTPEDSKLLPAEMLDHLPLERVTLAERLPEAGYDTAFIGKWHLYAGDDTQFNPLEQGFGLNIGGCHRGGPPTFFDPYGIEFLEDREKGEYLTNRLTDEAIGYMKKTSDAGKPFFLSLFLYTVHWPMEAPADLVAKYADRPMEGYNHKVYPAMIEAMDQNMGRLFAALAEMGIEEETLIVFTSDNGPFGGVGDVRPLRADKGHLYEGGIRVPLIVRWPGKTQAGRVSDEPVILTDFYPTLLEVAGLKPRDAYPGDGVSLVPHLIAPRPLEREAIFFHYPNFAFHKDNRLGSAVRVGDHKLIHFYDDDSVELYNLKEDLSETKDLAEDKPELAAAMKTRLQAWLKDSGAKLPRPR